LDDVSGFSEPLKKKGKKMGFEGKCLVLNNSKEE